MSRSSATFVLALALGVAPSLAARASEGPDLPLRLSAIAIHMGLAPRTATGTLDIVIERWSTDEETQRLVDLLARKGEGALLDAVQSTKLRAGYIRTPWSLGWDIAFARQEPSKDGGRRIVFATDRPMSFAERYAAGRSSWYEFMVGEVHFPAEGKGQGSLVTAARLRMKKDGKTLEIENFETLPVRLGEVILTGAESD